MRSIGAGASKRAIRRHHAARRKVWVRKNLPHYFLDPNDPPPRRVGLYANTPKVCSCWMCGNPAGKAMSPIDEVGISLGDRAGLEMHRVLLTRFDPGVLEEVRACGGAD